MPELNVQERTSLQLPITDAASLSADQVLERLGSGPEGLSAEEAAARLATLGPNAVRTHRANGWAVLGRQFASPILILLLITAGLSLFLGDATNSIVIGVILLVSVGLGFSNEFRAERAAEALHSRVTHRTVVVRDGAAGEVDVTALVPGDVVHLGIGAIIPADMRVLTAKNL
ncbi:MAG: cation-transporting P-type ATPase, partial [Pseudarthrobacter sp.]